MNIDQTNFFTFYLNYTSDGGEGMVELCTWARDSLYLIGISHLIKRD